MEYFASHAKFISPKEVDAGGIILTAPHILIATGTKPMIPDLPGKELWNIINVFVLS